MLTSMLAQSGSNGYMPHGMCYLWEPNLVWIHVISDSLTTLAYWAIPPFLVYLAVKSRQQIPSSAPYARRRLPYDWMFLAFGVFIVACGATHAMGIWTIWEPRYWLEGGVKAVTALASVATAIALPPLIPKALELIREARESEIRRVELEKAQREQEELVTRLREANEAKSRFLANVSHDLRTPLSLILGPIEELHELELPAEAVDRLETVQRNARTLEGQVEDLLAVGQMETSRLEPNLRPVDLPVTVREATEHYRSHAEGRQIEFQIETPDSLVARVDPELVKRAILNLLSNAFKFVPDGGVVRCALRSGPDAIEIEVADSGPGVPEDERDVVFERFRQGRSGTDRADGGSGLGLAIVREVADAHRGRVELDPSPEGGARFTMRLPAGTEPGVESGARPSPASRSEQGSTGHPPGATHPAREPGDDLAAASGDVGKDPQRATVLVVEDDPDMARHLGQVLSADFDVQFAEDGEEGLDKIVKLAPDLVLTDMMMPGTDGAALVAAVRDRPELSNLPIVVLTARAERELPERMLRAGAQDFVVKPARKDELKARIENLLELTGSRALLQESLESKEESLEQLARIAADRKQRLERSVEEKKVLLRELHHRVKGNLQTITSLLQLQLRGVEDEVARRSLEESRGRVAAMGLLHERLYRAGAPDRVELAGYLQSLVADVVRTRGAEGRVRTSLSLESMKVAVDDAIACGLIVHELVANAVTHAFPADATGTISLELRRAGDRTVLRVADDGEGMGGADPEAGSALGLQIVEALVGQLEGDLEVRTVGGTRVTIEFPTDDQDAVVASTTDTATGA